MTDDKKISVIIENLRNYALGDIKKSAKLDGAENMQIGTFILCSCFIDQVSAFYCGIKTIKQIKLLRK